MHCIEVALYLVDRYRFLVNEIVDDTIEN
jgi:hypothetical protein